MYVVVSKSKSQQGDTIVEVLIAIVVVSTILAGAYVTTAHSLNATRQAQERSEALKLIAAQAEGLKSISTENPLPATNVFNNPVSFCLNTSNAIVSAFNSNPQMGTVQPITNDADGDYAPGCQDGLPSGSTTVTYDLSIDRCDNGGTGKDCANIVTGGTLGTLFIIRARWDQAGGGGRDEALLIYRVYPFTLTNAGTATVGATPITPPPPPPPPPSGSADIGDCVTDPSDAICSGPAPPKGLAPIWAYDILLFNTSPVGQDVISCSWNWGLGDAPTGGPATDPKNACLPGQSIYHCFKTLLATKAIPPPQYFPNIVLTLTLGNGTQPTQTYSSQGEPFLTTTYFPNEACDIPAS